MKAQADCTHAWVSNGGQGGEPRFRRNRMMSNEPLMHVRCKRCGVRTWMTKERWNALRKVTPPRTTPESAPTDPGDTP